PAGASIPLGQFDAPSGASETTFATAVQVGTNGAATAFTLGGHNWDLARGDSGVVTRVQRDGAAVNATALVTGGAPGGARVAAAGQIGASASPASRAEALDKSAPVLDKTGAAAAAKSEKSPR
ncbi:MAG TPA: hypothetical protein VNO21_14660, partial [Polyangiaceae bacterium]|nr:hypothetical protein [Polyangiaceae bacterium]